MAAETVALARRGEKRRTIGLPPERPLRDEPSLQALFDRVVGAVRDQGYVKSEGASESCMYRGDEGTRCHVGLLIPPDAYRTAFEGCTVRELRELGLFFTALPDPHIDLLEHFQGIHDDDVPEDWETAFEALAHQLGLDYRRQK